MKNMRIPILSAMGVAIIGLIFGSIFDLKLSQAIASSTNGLGLFISVVGPTLGFCGLSFIGGGFFAISFKQKRIWAKVIYIVLALVAVGVTIKYAGTEYFGINGFRNDNLVWVGYIVAGICSIAAEVGGYYVFKDCENERAWIPFVCVYVVLLIVLVAAIPILKDSMHRPRFRTVTQGLVPFHAWYQKCGDYKEYMEKFGYISEEFKSFPSGHTGEASILVVVAVFAPIAYDKLKKYQLPMFIGACVFVIIVAFGRILAAAHYLSDTSMGALLTLTFTCIANEIVIFVDKKRAQKQQAAPPVAEPVVEETAKEEEKVPETV